MPDSIENIFYTSAKQTQHISESIKAAKYLNSPVLSPKSIRKNRIDYSYLKEGDYFGARAIVKKDGIEPAKFTVVSESREVKVFIVTDKNLNYLSEDFCVIKT